MTENLMQGIEEGLLDKRKRSLQPALRKVFIQAIYELVVQWAG